MTTKNGKKSKLYYTYYKPHEFNRCYKIEIKESIANDVIKLETILNTLKNEILFPEMIEPFAQFLADKMAKSASVGISAIKESIANDLTEENILDILPYRS